jgi:putative intracellular protease/amidase
VARVACPLPDRDFDPTEVAVPWDVLTSAGHEVVFATERGGSAAAADPRALGGILFGAGGADGEARALYRELEQAPEFRLPVAWSSLEVEELDGLVLPGGHAPGMRQYLDSALVQQLCAEFFRRGKPVGAICHGVLVAARAGVLRDRRTTCLPKPLERLGYYATAWRLGRYLRTYDVYVEDEVRAALADPAVQFERGPLAGLGSRPFVLVDGDYVSARWYRDARLFGERFLELLAPAAGRAA